MPETILNWLRVLNRGVASLVGLALHLCAGFVLADILLRQVHLSFGGTDEISGYVMAIATSWGMGYALMELAHVRIDLIRSRVGQLGRSLFDLFAMLVLSGSVTLIAYKCWPVLARSLNNSSRANTPLETPLALVQAPWFAGWIFFALVSWLTVVAALMLVLQRDYAGAEKAIGALGEAESLE